jgi:hypothetical protein
MFSISHSPNASVPLSIAASEYSDSGNLAKRKSTDSRAADAKPNTQLAGARPKGPPYLSARIIFEA